MRAGCVFALFAWLQLMAPAAAAEQEFPYLAYVAVSEATIRSGAGRNYYATHKLQAGETVEVYRQDGDWCGIRPPENSFSWVRADDLQIGRDGVGVVLNENAACRVGSGTSGLRDVIQVRLERGEQVEILDAVPISNDNGVEFYCKIAPPSGEFRWIHKDDISREDPLADRGNGDDLGRQRSPQARGDGDHDAHSARSDRWGSWVRSRRNSRDPTDDGGAGDLHNQSTGSQNAPIALASADGNRISGGQRGRSTNKDPEAIAGEIEAIDRELARIVVEDPSKWSFDSVSQRVEAALADTTTSEERTRARQLHDRIARFQDIQRRSVRFSPDGLAQSRSSASSDAMDHETSPGASTAAGHGGGGGPGRFDAVGKLSRVVSKRPNAPRYALVNSAGEVVSFLSPAAGVNLPSFEGQYVGVTGQRGYMPELKKPHVTALRVTALSVAQSPTIGRR